MLDFTKLRVPTRAEREADDRRRQAQAIAYCWTSFDEALNETATRMLGEARMLTSKLANDARDEDRDAPAGFDSRAQRARQFAADLTMQAYALLAAAEGAISAYLTITGEDWKPYNAPAEDEGVARKSAAAELSAFDA